MRVYDICIVGAGPAGLTMALDLADRGMNVAVLESGGEDEDHFAQQLSDAEIMTAGSHSAMNEAVRRGLGGTSALWGGRCVPLDSIDFENRCFVPESGWPFTWDELEKFYPRACGILGVGTASFEVQSCSEMKWRDRCLSPNFFDTDVIRATELERWSSSPNLWKEYRSKLISHPCITLKPGNTCIGFLQEETDSPVKAALVCPTKVMGNTFQLRARVYVLACGGVENTRLVLNSMLDPAGLKLQSPHLVGRYYMGHPSGKIADIVFEGKPSETIYGFEQDGDCYVRRRITFHPSILRREKLLNIAFWTDNAPLSDWHHKSGVLSAAYLALTAPLIGPLLAPAAIRRRVAGEHANNRFRHALNCMRSPIQTASFSVRFLYKRYFAKPPLPGFLTYSDANRYALHYHAEQAPNWNSTIFLSEKKDAHGLFRARIALNWSQQDIDSIVRAHHLLDEELQKQSIGKLFYRYHPDEIEHAVRMQAVDGFHQIGTLRMADDPSRGVTDSYGRFFGSTNMYAAGSAIFPTSGQANPTLGIVALALRQANHISDAFGQELNCA